MKTAFVRYSVGYCMLYIVTHIHLCGDNKKTETIWNEEKLLDFIVFSRKLVNSEECDSDGAFGVGFACL